MSPTSSTHQRPRPLHRADRTLLQPRPPARLRRLRRCPALRALTEPFVRSPVSSRSKALSLVLESVSVAAVPVAAKAHRRRPCRRKAHSCCRSHLCLVSSSLSSHEDNAPVRSCHGRPRPLCSPASPRTVWPHTYSHPCGSPCGGCAYFCARLYPSLPWPLLLLPLLFDTESCCFLLQLG